jgi:hypothetical protein
MQKVSPPVDFCIVISHFHSSDLQIPGHSSRSGRARRSQGSAQHRDPAGTASAASGTLLGAPQSRQRIVKALVGNPVFLDGVHERFERCNLYSDVATLADEHGIASGSDRLHVRSGTEYVFATAFISRSSLRITPGYPSSSRSNACTMRGDSVAGRSSSSAGTRRWAGHDERDVRANGLTKRNALDTTNSIGWMLDQRKIEVRIDRRVAVAGKMFSARGDPVALQSLDDRHTQTSHHRSVVRQRPIADDGILGFVWMSRTGAKSSVMPTAFISAASASANRRASVTSPLRPSTAMAAIR